MTQTSLGSFDDTAVPDEPPEGSCFLIPDEPAYTWDSMPCDIRSRWEGMYEAFEEHSKPRKEEIKRLDDEYAALQGNRQRWAILRKKALHQKVQALQKEIGIYETELEWWWLDQQIIHQLAAVEKARKLGLELDDEHEIEGFQMEYMSCIMERPGIEWCWEKKLSEVLAMIAKSRLKKEDDTEEKDNG